jgi:hypothetical protein
LVQFGLDGEQRRRWPHLVARAFYPVELREGTPPYVVADWFEEHGGAGTDVISMLRAIA